MKKVHFIIILITWSGISSAQNYLDIIKLDYTFAPANKFNSTSITTTLHEINGDLTVPINDNFTFLTGIVYENTSASFDLGRTVESFTGLTMKLGANISHNSKWSGT